MATIITIAEVFEGFALLFAGLGIVLFLQSNVFEGLLFFVMVAVCFVAARSIARRAQRRVAPRSCPWCGAVLEGNAPTCPKCGVSQQ